MTRNLRMYYYTILGALGGLVGWRLTQTIGFLDRPGGLLGQVPGVYFSDVPLGGALGLSIGFIIGLVEGILSRSVLRGLRAALISGGIGLLAGLLALPLGELSFLSVGGQVPGRALGWALFGALIGVANGVMGGSQLWKGALGGFIGGAVGGALLEPTLRQFDNPLLGKVAGLMLLGAAVGTFTALISVALSRAWLEVRSGKLKGTELILDKFLREGSPAAIIGSNVLKSDIALPDPGVAPQHAQLKGFGTHFTIRDMSVGAGTFVNGRKVERHRLSDRETIRVGSTELVYHEGR